MYRQQVWDSLDGSVWSRIVGRNVSRKSRQNFGEVKKGSARHVRSLARWPHLQHSCLLKARGVSLVLRCVSARIRISRAVRKL